MDGRLIFLHQLCGQTKRHFNKGERHISMSPKGDGVPKGRGHLRSRSHGKDSREKPGPDKAGARTKTDTGRRDEDSQALERTLVKELGKLTL